MVKIGETQYDIKTQIKEVSKVIRDRNREKGFTLSSTLRKLLVVAEAYEAFEAIRLNKFAIPLFVESEYDEAAFRQQVKDTVEDEFADIIIRMLDDKGSTSDDDSIGYIEESLTPNGTKISTWFGRLVDAIILGDVMDVHEIIVRDFPNINLDKHIEMKLQYNASRPHKHGKVF